MLKNNRFARADNHLDVCRIGTIDYIFFCQQVGCRPKLKCSGTFIFRCLIKSSCDSKVVFSKNLSNIIVSFIIVNCQLLIVHCQLSIVHCLHDDRKETNFFPVQCFHSVRQLGVEINAVALFQYKFFVVDLQK